jgi:pimeloyl-ACP methyl ester carboxylesterase
MGNGIIPNWVKESVHYTCLLIAKNMYGKPPLWVQSYKLKHNTARLALYHDFANDSYILGLRGSYGQSSKDYHDVKNILNHRPNDLTLVEEAISILNKYKPKNIVFTGHSLGANAAYSLCKRQDAKAVGFNIGAPPNCELSSEEGYTNYHICGDIKSMGFIGQSICLDADVEFGSDKAHDIDTFLGDVNEMDQSTCQEWEWDEFVLTE